MVSKLRRSASPSSSTTTSSSSNMLKSTSEHSCIRVTTAKTKLRNAANTTSTNTTTTTTSNITNNTVKVSRTVSLNARATPTTDRSLSSLSSSTSCSSSSLSTATKRQRVKFASREVLSEAFPVVPTRSELKPEDFTALWYCKDDFRKMKKNTILPIVRKLAKHLPLDKDDEPRGLEHKTPRGSKEREENRYNAMDAVLDEQERQWESNSRVDTEYLAQIYRQNSAHCQMKAYLIAKKDAEWVQENVVMAAAAAVDSDTGAVLKSDTKTGSSKDSGLVKIGTGQVPCFKLTNSKTPILKEMRNVCVIPGGACSARILVPPTV